MGRVTLGRPIRRPSVSAIVKLAAMLALISAVLMLAAPIGYRLGVLSLLTALLTVFKWGAYAAIATVALSLVGLIVTLLRHREERRGTGLAIASLIVGAAMIGLPASFLRGGPPPIHDITTDTHDPPQFVSVLPLRAKAPNTTVYGGEKIAAEQQRAYPDLQPLQLNVPPAQAFDRALAAVRRFGWDLVGADAAAGRIEATDTTFWFGFKDDVIVRLRPSEGGTRVDVRSLSRVGGGDVGTNAKRIRAYLAALKSST